MLFHGLLMSSLPSGGESEEEQRVSLTLLAMIHVGLSDGDLNGPEFKVLTDYLRTTMPGEKRTPEELSELVLSHISLRQSFSQREIAQYMAKARQYDAATHQQIMIHCFRVGIVDEGLRDPEMEALVEIAQWIGMDYQGFLAVADRYSRYVR